MAGKIPTSYRSIVAAGLLTCGSVVMAGAAEDPGGNCCLDLNERVAELEAGTARAGSRRVSLTISGQVSTALMVWDDGREHDAYVVDNAVSRSEVQLDGSYKITPDLRAGFELLLGLSAGARSHMVNQQDDNAVATSPGVDAEPLFSIEVANWYLVHTHLGRLAVGRVDTASDGTVTVDLGGAGVIANAEIGTWQRSFFLTRGNNQLTGTWDAALGGAAVNQAGLSRATAISYATPALAGFTASAAWSAGDSWDAALRYANELSDFRVAAAIAYANDQDDDLQARLSTWQGSGSIQHVASGLYLTSAFVNQDKGKAGVPDTRLWYLQGGISKNWTGLGSTVLYAEYARVKDGIVCGKGDCGAFGGDTLGFSQDSITGSEAAVWGVGVVQHINAAATEVFLAYRRYSAAVASPSGGVDGPNDDLKGTVAFSDFDVVMGGARITF